MKIKLILSLIVFYLMSLNILFLPFESEARNIERVNVDDNGVEGNGVSFNPSISSDGRFVAFRSYATNLVPGDTNSDADVFVYDRDSDSIERVSVNDSGVQGNDNSLNPSISSDGRYVAFDSYATNLVANDTNTDSDVFVYDRNSNTIERVSVNDSGVQGNYGSYDPSISSDGRYVAFYSDATDLIAGDTNGASDVFVYDRETGEIEMVSVNNSCEQGIGYSYYPSISSDGRYVAFFSEATNLVSDDTNVRKDVFVYDRDTGEIERISVDNGGVQGNDNSDYPSISSDGRYVAFRSSATNLVTGDTNGVSDVFVYDRDTDTIERVNVDSSGGEGNATSYYPSISSDGRYVAFRSNATNLVPDDTNADADVFVYDMDTDTIERISVDISGVQGDNNSHNPSISSNGRFVAFESYAANLVTGDTNTSCDVFVSYTVSDTSSPPVGGDESHSCFISTCSRLE